MLDVAIVGGGLGGLALADSLRASGRTFALFEARSRLGGRIFSKECTNGVMADLGPAWFWPQSQPGMVKLLQRLGLSSFPQYDTGAVLVLTDPDKAPAVLEGQSVHSGALRVKGGMGAAIEALVRRLPQDSLHLDHVLHRVLDRGSHVEMHFGTPSGGTAVAARFAVLAVPPRLLAEHVQFEPVLGSATAEAMRQTHTWMSAQAKVVIAFDSSPRWREAGISGNAFVQHEQAVLSEIFDACDGAGTGAALGGFLALAPGLRQSFRDGLPMLMGNQMSQLFGPGFEEGEQHYHDWAEERYTCSSLDRAPPDMHPHYGAPALMWGHWGGKLFFGGTETAADQGGYLEGALNAAARIERQLTGEPAAMTAASESNAASLAAFAEWVASRREAAFQNYRQRLNFALAKQQREQLTQRAMLGAMEQVFHQAVAKLEELPFDVRDVAIERGCSALTPQVQAAFKGFIQELLDAAVHFNRTSCALSNFPDEHRLSKDYTQAILLDIAAAWREFSIAANRVLIAKAAGMTHAGDGKRGGCFGCLGGKGHG